MILNICTNFASLLIKLLSGNIPNTGRVLVKRVRFEFERKYNDFLTKELEYVFEDQNSADLNGSTPPNIEGSRGRPRVKNEECSLRTQQRRAQELRRNYSQNILLKAVIPIQDPTVEDVEIKESVMTENYDNNFINKNLAMYMDIGLTKAKYENLRKHNFILFGNKQYPPYEKILLGKQQCYPENITITETGAAVELQSLLDLTVVRIFSLISKENLKTVRNKQLILHGKWGLDGASGQQVFKQKWANNESVNIDSSIFMVSYVPLNIMSSDGQTISINTRPSSVRLCRPIKFQFTKETNAKIQEEYDYTNEKINNLKITEVNIK